jgi:predicted CXXCH cytochrome family protein
MTEDQPKAEPNPGAPRRRRWAVPAVLLLAGLTAGGLILAAVARRPRPEESGRKLAADPPLRALASPFLNTRPGVKYVGDAACAGCHRQVSRSYHGQPMGRSVAPVSPGEGAERYPATFEAPHLRLSVQRRGDRVYHKVVYRDAAGKIIPGLEPAEAEVVFAVGSGTQGRSYLVNREGYLYQSPISWYHNKSEVLLQVAAGTAGLPAAPAGQGPLVAASALFPGRAGGWDLSPSYRQKFQHFNRPILDRCVYCHGDGAAPVGGAENQYRLEPGGLRAVGCERCHGPGELHVRARRRGQDPGAVDRTIVNPRHLEPALRRAVCEQCHLQGRIDIVRRGRSLWDYRPGLPLHEIVRAFIRPPQLADNYRAVGHPEQMQVSACFRGSGGKLGCTSCHDPHADPPPARRVAHYRRACLGCHGEGACHLSPAERRRRSPQDSCVQCHMPRAASSNVAHTAVTDHRIIRSPDKAPTPKSSLGPGDVPLLAFHRDLVRGPDPELDRDLGLALVHVGEDIPDERVRDYVLRRARPLLQAALDRAPGDAAAATGQAHALLLLDRPAEGLALLEQVLTRAPRDETALDHAAHAALTLRRRDLALGYARRLVEVNPWSAAHHALLASVQAEREDWPAALEAAHAALRRDPADVMARIVLVSYHLAQGDRAAARADYDRLLALEPVDKEGLRRWFEQRTR